VQKRFGAIDDESAGQQETIGSGKKRFASIQKGERLPV